jgi:hypothetical protein
MSFTDKEKNKDGQILSSECHFEIFILNILREYQVEVCG